MKPSLLNRGISRRRFVAAAGAALALPTFIPASALGKAARPAPSNRIAMGIVGWGMMGPGNTSNFLKQPDCQVVAVCDIDKNHLEAAAGAVNKHYGNQDCRVLSSYRELMARDDVDAVMLAVPDHWHALTSVEAARHNKAIYGEKPLATTVAEQQAIVNAVKRTGVVWQTGSWQRSTANFHKACEIVRNGLIGTVQRVEVGLPAGHVDFAKTKDKMNVTGPPPELDYETWIGPAAMMPYIEGRVHKNWRWNYNTGGGQLLDWIGHHCDIAHWGLDFDATGPTEIEGQGDFPPQDAVWNTCTKYRIELKYPGNVSMTIAGGHPDIRSGTKWIGNQGWVWVDRGGFESSNPKWKDIPRLPADERTVSLYHSTNHWRNFLECIKSRTPTITPVDVAHRSAIPGHLGLIAMRTGRKLRWDAVNERIIGDAAANGLLSRPYRAPWTLA